MARKLFKVAKEFNLGSDTLTNFLVKLSEEKKIKINLAKSVNSDIDDDIFELIKQKFSKELEKEEKHRKIKHDEELAQAIVEAPPAPIAPIKKVEEVIVEEDKAASKSKASKSKKAVEEETIAEEEANKKASKKAAAKKDLEAPEETVKEAPKKAKTKKEIDEEAADLKEKEKKQHASKSEAKTEHKADHKKETVKEVEHKVVEPKIVEHKKASHKEEKHEEPVKEHDTKKVHKEDAHKKVAKHEDHVEHVKEEKAPKKHTEESETDSKPKLHGSVISGPDPELLRRILQQKSEANTRAQNTIARAQEKKDKEASRNERPSYNRDNQGGDRPRPSYNRDGQTGERPPYNRDNQGGDRPRPSYNRDGQTGERPAFNRDNQGGDRPRPSYNRDGQTGERPPYNRDNQSGDRPRPSYNRDGQSGERPAYNRDNQGGDRPRPSYNRDGQSGERPAYNRDNQSGDRPRPSYNRDGQSGERPPYNRDNQGGDRPRPSYNRDGQSGERPPYNRDGQSGSSHPQMVSGLPNRGNFAQGQRYPSQRDGSSQGGASRDGARPSYPPREGFNRDGGGSGRPSYPPRSGGPGARPNTSGSMPRLPDIGPVLSQKDLERKRAQKQREEELEKEAKKRQALEKLRKQGKNTQVSLDKMIRAEDGEFFKKRKKAKKTGIDSGEVAANIKTTLATTTSKKKRKKIKKQTEDGQEVEVNVIKISEFMTAQDLASIMEISVADIIKKCMLDFKMMVSINQRLDLDTIKLLAESYSYEVEEEEEFGSDYLEEIAEDDDSEVGELVHRHPVVTVMGHVDHGKTSLLDYIRKARVVAGESGGITQHIGAYEVTTAKNLKITFLDTPGHEAFTAMRARGAQATDIAIIIVASDDGVMPQTREAIDHCRAAGVPMVIAISKIDKPAANIEKVYQMLSEYDVLVEEWGGKYQTAKVSSKSGVGIDELLDKVLLEAEVLDLKATPERRGRGVVVETQMALGKGTVATVIVQDGTVNIGDSFVMGQFAGKIKAMYDERNHNVKTAGPSTPVQILGIEGVPQAGDRFLVMENINQAKEISNKRQQLKREQDIRTMKKVTLEDISRDISLGGVQDLNIIVKGDVDGSVEALSDSLIKLSHDEIRVRVIRKAVGPISESDVILASASNAIIIGFHVRPVMKAAELADKEAVQIKIYRIVYDAINDIKAALEGMLRPELKENKLGEVEILEVYKISRLGNIAGCMVRKGTILRSSKVRLIRDGIEVFDGKISTLKRFKDDVKDVREGFECGIALDGFNDIKKGDMVEVYETVEVARKL